MNKKLTGWKNRFLNTIGRATLATSTLNSIPNHIMQCHKLSKKKNSLIDRTQRNFIWGSTAEKLKPHLVNWHTLTDTKNYGGLGIVSTEYKNLTIHTNLAWRLFKNPHFLWARDLINKYCCLQRNF